MRKVLLAFAVTLCLSISSYAQKTITGKVTDADGKPMSNVSVLVKGTTIGTTTNADGTYSLPVQANGKVLEFSSLGFETQTVNVGNKSDYSPVLVNSEAKNMKEVVVTGVNRIKKSQYTGAATKIDEKQIKNQPAGSFEQVLQGRAPGVTVLTTSGQPGSASTVIIRGRNSILGGNDPLYIVDGIPVEAGVFQGLNSNDFASIDVLRDAASTSLYGSRGSAGVIVVTTKKGVAGKMRLSYSGQFGQTSRPDFAFRPMNTSEILRAQEDYGRVLTGNNSNDPVTNNINMPGFYYSKNNPRYGTLSSAQQAANDRLLDSISKINSNWQDEIFRTGNFSNHEIALSGGTGKTRLYSNLGIYNEEGITLRTDMKRITWRNNMDYADDRFTLAVNSNISYSKRNFQQSTQTNSTANPFLSSAVTVPYAKIYNNDGSYATGLGNSFAAANQLDLTKWDENYNDQIKVNLGAQAAYNISAHFIAGITAGVDFRETQNSNYGSKQAFVRLTSTSITGKAGFQTEGLTRFLRGTVRPSITYKQIFRENHDVEAAVYGEYIHEFNKSFQGTGFGTDPKRPNTIAAVTPGNAQNQLYQSVTGSKSQTALLSALATVRYTYRQKYTITGSYRRDGSSKLPEDNRWTGFFSVGAVWEAHKESFIREIKAINVLRLKLSYGSAGNSDNFPFGNYPYQPAYNNGFYSGLTTIVATNPGNADMKWETTYVLNFGIDYELFNRSVYGDINLYDKRTKDLFVQKNLSATAGFGNNYAVPINAGEVSNRGIEVSLNIDVIRKKDFVWTLFGNFSYNRNRVESLGGALPYEVGTELIAEGKPLGTHYEVKWGGVDAATGIPLYYDISGNLTPVYSASNRVQDFGTWEAPWRGGFGTRVGYRGFELSTLFSWQSGATKSDNMEFFLENPTGFLYSGYNQSSSLNFWQKPGDVVNTPSPQYGVQFSSKTIHDASFMRLRELKLSYTIPRKNLEKVKYLNNLSIYVMGNNLALWTHWRGTDPEAGGTNINLSEFPNPRRITAGINVTF